MEDIGGIESADDVIMRGQQNLQIVHDGRVIVYYEYCFRTCFTFTGSIRFYFRRFYGSIVQECFFAIEPFLFCVREIVCGQNQDKHGSVPFFPVCRFQVSVVQPGKASGIIKPDAGSPIVSPFVAFYLIEPFKDFFQLFFRNVFSGVGYGNPDIPDAFVLFCQAEELLGFLACDDGERDFYFTSCRSKLHGIGKQIAQYFLYFVFIGPIEDVMV